MSDRIELSLLARATPEEKSARRIVAIVLGAWLLRCLRVRIIRRGWARLASEHPAPAAETRARSRFDVSLVDLNSRD